MSISTALSMVLQEINWILFAFSVLAAFLVGALWYSLVFFKVWNRVFRLESNAMNHPMSMVRSFVIQCITGTMFGFVIFVLSGFAAWLGWLGVLTIAGWQMCALTFKYSSWKNFLLAVMVESGYTIVAGAIYMIMANI